MTIEEAINHCHEKAQANRKMANDKFKAYYKGIMPSYVQEEHDDCIRCAEDHEQLAGWLEELMTLRDKLNEIEAILNSREESPVDRRDVPRGTIEPDIPLDELIGKDVIIYLKDGEKLTGKLSCDSRYLQISDHVTGEPFIFYGKDIESITIMEEL